MKCIFCENDASFVFRYNKYDIAQCHNCKTTFVMNMPSADELEDYYSGFNYAISDKNKEKILSPHIQKWFESLNLPKNAKMLDIGGGGGFFSLAFEKFGFGKATYIDLDNKACAYAENLGISRVINNNVTSLLKIEKEKYDFIYCRHVIEHLIDPRVVIDAGIDLLSKDGIFVLHFPNGRSYERIPDHSHYLDRIDRLTTNNPQFSTFKKFCILHSEKTSFGLHPKRHLWAISPKGISLYLQKKKVSFSVNTYSIDNQCYSPYSPVPSISRRLIHMLYSLPQGKSHLVVNIKRM